MGYGDLAVKALEEYMEAVRVKELRRTYDLSKPVWLNPPYSNWYKPVRLNPPYSKISMYADCWGYEPKEKMENTNKKYWLVVNIDCQTVCNNGKRFNNEYDALCAAESWAKQNPGMEYVVTQAVSVTKVTTPAITTRLA